MRFPVSILALATGTVLAALGACGGKQAPYHELTGPSMGTTYSIKVVDLGEADEQELRSDIVYVLTASEQLMSTYIADSDVSQFNAVRDTDWVSVSPELCTVVELALGLSEMTGGAFDVTVGPVVNLWGFGPVESLTEPPDDQSVDTALESVGYRRLGADCERPALRKEVPDLQVDLSAFGKGFTVDKVAHVLDTYGITDYLVEIGGELRMRGLNAAGKPWAIAIETPRLDGRSVQSIADLTDTGMATSGDYRNFFEHNGTLYSHTINPSTGRPVTHGAASVTVIAESTAFADAMATALLVMGPETGIEYADERDIAAYFLVRDGEGIVERYSETFGQEVALR
ncbi:MAG: FAD:protein FMN transferase [Woeseiaceae bacterium]|nr:FAD:protein FMN transferase [Woeseiaceae bacterium]